jgi:CO/xanthine dehydrogenase Mo-binding subunit
MAPYIGTAVSRVDGVAKVTGAAKYAAEVNVPGLAYGSIVGATIAKGRITRIDTSAALGVDGVLTVLTHENRPRMADNDQAYKDDIAPDGSPFRPLYDDAFHTSMPSDAGVGTVAHDIRRNRHGGHRRTRSSSTANRSRWSWPRRRR